MATLRSAVSASDREFRITTPGSASKGLRLRLDDELIDLVDFAPFAHIAGKREPGADSSRWIVQRGVGGTAPASHNAGTTLYATTEAVETGTTLTPPDPFPDAGGGLPPSWTQDGSDVDTGGGFLTVPRLLYNSGAAAIDVDSSGGGQVQVSDLLGAVRVIVSDVLTELLSPDNNHFITVTNDDGITLNVGSSVALQIQADGSVTFFSNDPVLFSNGLDAGGYTIPQVAEPSVEGEAIPLRSSSLGLLADITNGGTRPQVPATPTEQDIADALVLLGLVTQAAP